MIAEILVLLDDGGGWTIAAWFLFLNGRISSVEDIAATAPAHVLACREVVLFAAHQARALRLRRLLISHPSRYQSQQA